MKIRNANIRHRPSKIKVCKPLDPTASLSWDSNLPSGMVHKADRAVQGCSSRLEKQHPARGPHLHATFRRYDGNDNTAGREIRNSHLLALLASQRAREPEADGEPAGHSSRLHPHARNRVSCPEHLGGTDEQSSFPRGPGLRHTVVLDEPTSALDVSLQAQIVNLLQELRRRLSLAYILITHQFSIARQLCDRLLVMYLGKPMEMGPTGEIIDHLRHPYSRALIRSIPLPDPSQRIVAPPLTGEIPSPTHPPSGCRFHPRCPEATHLCSRDEPAAQQVEGITVWCHLQAPQRNRRK